MILKITSITDDKLGNSDAKMIKGTRADNGEEWSKKFFADNKELRSQLDEFGVGEFVKIKLKQNPKNKNWWDIQGFSAASPEEVKAIEGKGKSGSPSGNRGFTSGGGTRSSLTKEEWAEKDRKAKIGMSIHNAVAAASRVAKAGTSAEALIEYAKELLPFLMLDELPGQGIEGDDPLAPPVDD
jgi:hypothetical protein